MNPQDKDAIATEILRILKIKFDDDSSRDIPIKAMLERFEKNYNIDQKTTDIALHRLERFKLIKFIDSLYIRITDTRIRVADENDYFVQKIYNIDKNIQQLNIVEHTKTKWIQRFITILSHPITMKLIDIYLALKSSSPNKP